MEKDGTPLITVPEYVKGLKVEDLNELCTNTAALSGLWEKTTSASAIHEHQLQLAAQNEQRAGHVKESFSKVEALREELSILASKEAAAQEHWQDAESAMYHIVKPFLPAAAKAAVEKEVAENDTEASFVDRKFRDGMASDDDPIGLARQYVACRRQYYYGQGVLESIP